MVNDDGVEPYWLTETDWLAAIVMPFGDEPDDDDPDLNWAGQLFAFSHATDTRMLALVGDPEGPMYVLLFSFTSKENKKRFLELVRMEGYADPEEESTFSIPSRDEIEAARPVAMVFPKKQAECIVRVAATTTIGLQTDAENSDA